MVITQLGGGLGNQMFQYAAGRQIAHARGAVLKVDVRLYLDKRRHVPMGCRKFGLSNFNIEAEIASNREIYKLCPLDSLTPAIEGILPARLATFAIKRLNRTPLKSPYYFRLNEYDATRPLPKLMMGRVVSERFYHFDPEVPSSPDDVCLAGFWQSEKYFRNIADIIRREFTVKTPPAGRNLEVAEKIKGTNSVSLHIRRGDMVKLAHHCPTTAEYCAEAMKLMRARLPDPTFFVFSDDWEWVKSNLPAGAGVEHVDHNGGDADYEDLRLMSLCRHNITAASTFSWWGAWLNGNPGKIVVCPKNWTKVHNHDTKDVYPPEWVII